MNIFYLFASVFTRGITLINILLIGYLLGSDGLGRYLVLLGAATLMNTIFAYWIQVAVSKYYRTELDSETLGQWQTTFFVAILLSSFFILIVAAAYSFYPQSHLSLNELIFVAVLASSTSLCDITGAHLNGNAQSLKFFRFGLFRALAGFLFSLCAVAIGFGAFGAAFSILLGQTLVFVLPENRQIWVGLTLKNFRIEKLRSALQFGIPAAIIFGFYPFLQSILRNLMSVQWGDSITGLFSMVFEVAIAPLSLVGSTLIYTLMPKAFISENIGVADQRKGFQDFNELLLLLCAVHLVCGIMMGEDILSHYLPPNFREHIGGLVLPAIFFSVGAVFCSGQSFLINASGKSKLSVGLILGCLSTCIIAISGLVQKSYIGEANLLAFAAVMWAFLFAIFSSKFGFIRFDLSELTKMTISIFAMWGSFYVLTFVPQWNEPLSKTLISFLVLASCAVLMRSRSATRFLHFE
jgi:O-antigen/teichoic acid export membrane protein